MFFNPTSDTNENTPDTPRRTEKPRTASDHFAQTIGVTLATGPPHLGDQVVTGKNREIRFVTCWALRIGLFWLLSLSLSQNLGHHFIATGTAGVRLCAQLREQIGGLLSRCLLDETRGECESHESHESWKKGEFGWGITFWFVGAWSIQGIIGWSSIRCKVSGCER